MKMDSKDILDPHIIIGGKIQLLYGKDVYSPDTQKRTAEVTVNSAQNICRREECTIVEETFVSTAKIHTRQDTRKYVKNIEWKQQSKKNEIKQMKCIHSKKARVQSGREENKK